MLWSVHLGILFESFQHLLVVLLDIVWCTPYHSVPYSWTFFLLTVAWFVEFRSEHYRVVLLHHGFLCTLLYFFHVVLDSIELGGRHAHESLTNLTKTLDSDWSCKIWESQCKVVHRCSLSVILGASFTIVSLCFICDLLFAAGTWEVEHLLVRLILIWGEYPRAKAIDLEVTNLLSVLYFNVLRTLCLHFLEGYNRIYWWIPSSILCQSVHVFSGATDIAFFAFKKFP